MKILLLDPHLDDIALNCSGYLAMNPDNDYLFIGFSRCENKELYREWIKYLSQYTEKSHFYNLNRRTFTEHRQEILNKLLKVRREFNPDIIFCPSDQDLHQDHQVVTAEAIRAFPDKTIIMYGNHNYILQANYFVEIEHTLVNKITDNIIKIFSTQSDRSYFTAETIKAKYRATGMIIRRQFAEGFKVFRFIDKKS